MAGRLLHSRRLSNAMEMIIPGTRPLRTVSQ